VVANEFAVLCVLCLKITPGSFSAQPQKAQRFLQKKVSDYQADSENQLENATVIFWVAQFWIHCLV
jgi:hypothetical protein